MWWTWCVQAIPVDRNSFQCHILINLPFEHSSEHSHYIWVTETLCKPHENALKQYRNPQYYTWNASGDHILALSSLSCSHWNITNLNTECIWAPKEVCTHCQHSTEWWPRPQEQEGALGASNQRDLCWIHLHMFNKCHWQWRETFDCPNYWFNSTIGMH